MTIETKAREWAEKNVRYDNGKSALQQLEEAYLAGAAGAMEWVPVSEQKPQQLQVVLIPSKAKGRFPIQSAKYFTSDQNGEHLFEDEYGGLIRNVTHWMPLPTHPAKEQL